LQVFPEGAQKLALASQIGRLSLALRNVEDQSPATGQRVVTTRDRSLSGGLYMPERRQASAPASAPALAAATAASATAQVTAPRRPTGPAMTVIRGTEITEEEISRHAS
jgi:pilus assembly protein CpaB